MTKTSIRHEYALKWGSLVSILCRVILRRHHQTSTLSRASVNRLDYVNHLLFVLQRPVNLVVVTSAQIDHDVLVAEEEHAGAWIIQFVPEKEIQQIDW